MPDASHSSLYSLSWRLVLLMLFAPQAACIWLYTLVKQCSQHQAVQSQLLQIQRGFIRLLSDSDGKLGVERMVLRFLQQKYLFTESLR